MTWQAPRATRLAMPMEHSQDSQEEAVWKPPIIFLIEGPGLSVKFQYLSENTKQFESNTIWKALGGSHYLRTCHREEKPTLISEGTEASQVSWNDSPAACCSSSLVTFSL